MTEAGISLRSMRTADLPTIMELERSLFRREAWSKAMFEGELVASSRHYIVAEEGGIIVGYAGLAAAAGEGDVQTIAVRPESEGGGIGTRMLTALLDEAASRGCKAVFLEVRADNERALNLYQRFGFTKIGVRKRYYQPSGVDAIVMCLVPLNPRVQEEEPA